MSSLNNAAQLHNTDTAITHTTIPLLQASGASWEIQITLHVPNTRRFRHMFDPAIAIFRNISTDAFWRLLKLYCATRAGPFQLTGFVHTFVSANQILYAMRESNLSSTLDVRTCTCSNVQESFICVRTQTCAHDMRN